MISFHRILPRLILAVAGSGLALAARAESDVRFSATLTPAQREQSGLTRLSDDNIAVIDGLVRQDEAASKFKDNDVDHTRFSQRRTARELAISGLNRLSSSQVAQLDAFVGRRISGIAPAEAAGTFVATASASAGVKPNLATHKLDIHGELSYTYGWSKGGNFQGADLVLNYEDPAGRYAVQIGYSEYHGKGLTPCFLPGYGQIRP